MRRARRRSAGEVFMRANGSRRDRRTTLGSPFRSRRAQSPGMLGRSFQTVRSRIRRRDIFLSLAHLLVQRRRCRYWRFKAK